MVTRFKISNKDNDEIPYTLWYKMLRVLYIRDRKTFDYFKTVTELVEQKNIDMLEIDLEYYNKNNKNNKNGNR